ncbi:MAG: stage II sporulation protein M [Spirochaetales bacterium]|nr:stage II sporulation protein M [Spirochaetales bacterium]
MKQDTFKRQREKQWQSFEELLAQLSKRKHVKAKEFPLLYRRICHDLNIARAQNFNSQLIERLNKLAVRGHQLLYKPAKFTFKELAQFIIWGFPHAVRKEIRLVIISAVLFFGSLCGVFLYIRAHPESIYSFIDTRTVDTVETIYDPDAETFHRPRGDESDAEMFGFYVYNNISINFRTFAGGALLGFGSLFILMFNSVYIGAIAAHIVNIGFSETFFPFVSGHSAFELTAVIFVAVAGFRLGWSLISPGRYSRKQAFKRAAYRAIPIVYGSVLMTFLAAIIEAFWSAYPMDSTFKYIAGAGLWVLLFMYFIFAGRKKRYVSAYIED